MPFSTSSRRQWETDNLARAASILEALKLDTGCIDCGYAKHPSALHFDHRDPDTKRHDLGWVNDRSKLVTRTRLERFLHHVRTYCDVRCANCHAIRTATEGHYLNRRGSRQTESIETLF